MNKIYIKTGEINGVETGLVLKAITINAEVIVGGNTQGGNTKYSYGETTLQNIPKEMIEAVFNALEPRSVEADNEESEIE